MTKTRMMMMTMTIKTTMTARTLQEGTTARKIPATDPAKKNVRQLVMRINLLTMYFLSLAPAYTGSQLMFFYCNRASMS